jgi:hypothetical protein
MKHVTITFAVIVLVAQTAQAGHLGFGGGGPGLGGHHGGFGDGGFGRHDELGLFGGFGLDTERLQARFETKFEDLVSDYDTRLADIEDFFSSEEYSDVVGGMERLVDRYDLFFNGVERSIDRLGDFISIASDDLTYYDDLIVEYEAREDLSEEGLERILDRLTNVRERLTTKIDFLTEKQTTLSENFASYDTFSTDLSTYLAEIVTAGGGTIDDSTEETLDALALSSPLRSTAPLTALADHSMCEMSEAIAANAAPEPGAQLLSTLVLAMLALRRPKRPPERAG